MPEQANHVALIWPRILDHATSIRDTNDERWPKMIYSVAPDYVIIDISLFFMMSDDEYLPTYIN